MIEKGMQYNIPVLNLYDNLGINPNIEEEKEKYITDGLHFNDEGHKVIADCVSRFTQSL